MIPNLDYTTHPVFGPLIPSKSPPCSLGRFFSEIDEVVAENNAEALIGLRERIDVTVQELPELSDDFRASVLDCFSKTIERRVDEEQRRSRCVSTFASTDRLAKASAESLVDQGYTSFRMPSNKVAELRKLLKRDIDVLRARSEEYRDNTNFVAPSDARASELVEQFCRDTGVFHMLSSFFGEPYERLGFVVHLSQPTDTWFRVFDDLGMSPSDTIQMHLDLAFHLPKAMLYVNDVREENGPFSLVPKHSTWNNFNAATAFRRELGHSMVAYADQRGHKLQGNQSLFRFPLVRDVFAGLPDDLRQTAGFGEHVVDGSALSQSLLDKEIKITGEAGEMPLFMGSHVTHRGGIVHSGERIALQIVFYPGKAKKRRLVRRAKQAMRRFVSDMRQPSDR